MSITSSTPFLSINIAPSTASSKSNACGGIFPEPKLKIPLLKLFDDNNCSLFSTFKCKKKNDYFFLKKIKVLENSQH